MAYRWQGGRRSCKHPSRTPQEARPYAIGNATSPSPEAKAKMTWGAQHGLFGEAKLLKDQQDSGFDVKATPQAAFICSLSRLQCWGGGTTNRPCRARFLSHVSTQDTRNTQRKLLSTYRKELTEATGQITDTSWGQRAHTARPYLKFHARRTNLQ